MDSMTEDDPEHDVEDDAREYLRSFVKWFGGGSRSRKLAMVLLATGMSAPFILGLTAIFVVLLWIAPVALDFTERLAVFGVLFSLLTAISLQVASVSQRMVFGLFFMRRKRKPKTPETDYITKLP